MVSPRPVGELIRIFHLWRTGLWGADESAQARSRERVRDYRSFGEMLRERGRMAEAVSLPEADDGPRDGADEGVAVHTPQFVTGVSRAEYEGV